MRSSSTPDTEQIWNLLADGLAERLAQHLAPLLAELVSGQDAGSPWLTTYEAVEYTRLPESTFRKLASCGKIPSHGGRAKLFYRPELDTALLGLAGLAEDERRLRSVT
jgi:hypothetical protein